MPEPHTNARCVPSVWDSWDSAGSVGGAWTISPVSKKIEQSYAFINFMCRPDVQDLVSRKLGTVPTVERKHLTLTDQEFAAVSTEVPPIIPDYALHSGERQDFVTQKWSEIVTG